MSRRRPPAPGQTVMDAVIEAYKKDVDRTLLRENLKLTTAERMERFEANMPDLFELQSSRRRDDTPKRKSSIDPPPSP